MTSKQRSQWRTVATALVLAGVALGGAFALRNAGDLGGRMYGDLCWTLVLLAATVAGKSSVEHLAVGGGVKGAVTALLAPAKPADPPPVPPAAP